MVIESLKAVRASLKEAMKDKDMSDATRKRIGESDAALQTLLEKAREAAEKVKEGGMKQGEEGEEGYEEGMPAPGHTITKTTKVKHDKHQDTGDDEKGEEEEEGTEESSKENDMGDDKDDKDDKDSEEAKRGYIRALLKEAGIPKSLWSLDKLVKLSLSEAKAEIADKKAIVEEVHKANEIEFVPTGSGEPLHESEPGNMNGLFAGVAR